MKKLVFNDRDRWFYLIAVAAFLVSIALLLCGRERLGRNLAVGVFSGVFAFAIARGHLSGFYVRHQSDEKNDHQE